MTRAELEAAIKDAMNDLIGSAPCINCGGNPFAVRANIEASSFYIFELVKRWREDRGQIPIEKAVKKAAKATELRFRDKSYEELLAMITPPPEEESEPEEAPAAEAVPLGGGSSGEAPGLEDSLVDAEPVGDEIGGVEPGLTGSSGEEAAGSVPDLVGPAEPLEEETGAPPEERVEPSS